MAEDAGQAQTMVASLTPMAATQSSAPAALSLSLDARSWVQVTGTDGSKTTYEYQKNKSIVTPETE